MSSLRSLSLNHSHWAFTFLAYATKSSSSLIIFKHLYLVWNKLSRSPNILDRVSIVSSNDISSGLFGNIWFIYFMFSWAPNFWSTNIIFSSLDHDWHLFAKIVSYLLKYAGKVIPSSGLLIISDSEFAMPSAEKVFEPFSCSPCFNNIFCKMSYCFTICFCTSVCCFWKFSCCCTNCCCNCCTALIVPYLA